MDKNTEVLYQERLTELAEFCFKKLANLESRFMILCHRAEAAGIDCSDLHPPITELTEDPGVKLLN